MNVGAGPAGVVAPQQTQQQAQARVDLNQFLYMNNPFQPRTMNDARMARQTFIEMMNNGEFELWVFDPMLNKFNEIVKNHPELKITEVDIPDRYLTLRQRNYKNWIMDNIQDWAREPKNIAIDLQPPEVYKNVFEFK